jgi:hypothetical protein
MYPLTIGEKGVIGRMKQTHSLKLLSIAVLASIAIAGVLVAQAQYGSGNKPQETAMKQQGAPTLTATLVDPQKKAQQKAATVEVKTTGINLIDPAKANEMAKPGQGHLHYQVDDGPVIATPATKLSFHGLASGAHKIVIMLAGNDHNPLGPQQTLEVTIP